MRLVKHDEIRKLIVTPPSPGRKALALAAGLALAVLVRLALDGGSAGFLFLTFLPVVLLASVLLGSRWAILGAVLSMVLVRLLFLPDGLIDLLHPARALVFLLLYTVTVAIIIRTGHAVRALVIENEAHRKQQEVFNLELQHRTKNALQMMRALIARGPREDDPATYVAKLGGRLDALAKANELLRFGILTAAPLADLVRAAIAPFDPHRIQISGPACWIDRSAATPLMMALHELCTNATKYGGLSTDQGEVSIRWTVEPDGAPGTVRLVWEESGGPSVSPPTHRGLGARLLAPNGGMSAVQMEWRPQGLVCTLEARTAPPAEAAALS